MNTSIHHSVNSWATLATFNRADEAQKVQALLESNGVETKMEDERRLQRFWFLVSPRAGVHLSVLKDAYEAAKRFLNQNPELIEAQKNMVLCPSCHSSRVQYPALPRKYVLPTLVAHVLVFLRFMEHAYYCKDCHFTWTAQEQDRRHFEKCKAGIVK